MSSTDPTRSQAAPAEPQSAPSSDIGQLKRQESRYWYLLAAICIITTAGLGFAISPLLDERVLNLWPWANTQIVLLGGLSLSMWVLVTYLTVQKRRTRDVRRRMEQIAEESTRRARQNSARLRALLNVSRMMGSVTNIENVFDSITDTCLEVFDCQQASLMLLNEKTRELETRAATGHDNKDEVMATTLKIGEGVAGWVAEHQQPIVLARDTDLSQYPNLELRDASISAAMVVPILLREELVGVLNISSRSPEADYSNEDLQALRVFAENAGTCIRHTEHVEWMRKTIRDTLDQTSKTHHNPKYKNLEALTRE